MEKTYSKEEIEGYLLKKKKEGANEITLHQLQMAFLLRIPMEAIEVMGEVAMKDFEKREWILALAMEGFPQEQLMELVTLSIQEIKDKKVDYFRKQQIKEVQNLEVELLEMARRVETALHEKELFHKYSKAMEELIKEKDEAIERLKKIYEPSQLKDTPSEKTSVIRVNNQTFSKKGRIRKYIERWRIKKEEKEILELIRDPELTEEQTEFLLKARQEGMQLEKIRHLAIPGISVQRMEQMKIYMMEDKNETIRRKNS